MGTLQDDVTVVEAILPNELALGGPAGLFDGPCPGDGCNDDTGGSVHTMPVVAKIALALQTNDPKPKSLVNRVEISNPVFLLK